MSLPKKAEKGYLEIADRGAGFAVRGHKKVPERPVSIESAGGRVQRRRLLPADLRASPAVPRASFSASASLAMPDRTRVWAPGRARSISSQPAGPVRSLPPGESSLGTAGYRFCFLQP